THADTYGEQESANFNAHYGTVGFHPLVAFDGVTGDFLKAQLRPGSVYTSNGVVEFMEPVIKHYNEKFPETIPFLRGDSASSMINISGSMFTDIAKPSLDFIPLEYVFTGWSIKSPNSENSMIPASNALISCFVKPSIKHFNSILSLPVKSSLRPAATAINDVSPL